MGILDDAIREHLDLKRKHGARDAELREIEDEAFGSTDRPDAFSGGELFSEVAGSGTAAAEAVAEPGELDVGGEEPTRLVEPTALRPETDREEVAEEPASPPEGLEQVPGQEEMIEPIPGQEALLDQGEALPSSESLEELIAEEEPFPEDQAAPPPAPETAEPLPESEVETPEPSPEPPEPEPEETGEPEPEETGEPEPESATPDPPPPPPEAGSEPPGRARGRVDVPTQEHPPPGDTGGIPPLPESELRPDPLGSPDDEDSGPALYDFETDEDPLEPEQAGGALDDDFEALGPAEEEAPYLDEEESYAEEPLSTPQEDPGTAVRPADEEEEEELPRGDVEVFDEEGEDDLWFEKGPPQDFDFDED